jgi:integrase
MRAANVPATPNTWIKIATYNGRAFWEVAFMDDGRETKRRIGPAWLVPVDDASAKPNGKTYRSGQWVERRGRASGDALTYDTAREQIPSILAEFYAAKNEARAAAQAVQHEAQRPRTFRELAHAWRRYLDHKGTKPSTLVGYDAMLAEPGTAFKRGSGTKVGYILAALGDLPAADVTVGHVETLLATIAETGASARTVEKHRIMVRSILNHGIRETKRAQAGRHAGHGHDYGLTVNAAQVAEGPRQKSARLLVYYLPEEIEAIARALEDGLHRHAQTHHQAGCEQSAARTCNCRPQHTVGQRRFDTFERANAYLREHRDEAQLRSDSQDAAAVRLSAYTGLRLGELLALRRR